jgi:ABC-type glycerol-3-phosphate transport system substrate-binding protein
MTRRLSILVTLLMVVAMALGACITPSGPPAAAPAAEGEAAAPAAEGEPIELLYMTHNHAQSLPVNEAIIAEFEAAHPNVNITFDNAPHDNYEQKATTAKLT